MFINLRLSSLGLLVAFVISGCQSPYNKWATASQDRTRSKSKSQGDDDRAAWPPKSDKKITRLTKVPDSKSESQAKTSDPTKEALQLADLLEKGDRFRKSGQYEDARVAYSGALTISPDNPDVNHRLAIIADKQQQFSLADQYYQAALRVQPQDANLLSDLGYSYSLRGNTKQAEQTLKQALAIDPTHRGAMANLGTIYAQQNRYTDALIMSRKGSSSEAEARRNIAKFFPDATSDVIASSDKGASDTNLLMASNPPESIPEISQFSREQLQLELARREQSGQQGRSREKSWDEPEPESEKFEQRSSQPPRTASINSDREPDRGARQAELSRSQADPQILQTRAQSNGEPVDTLRPSGGANPANRIATRIGMNCGPGNLFPILPLNSNSSTNREVIPTSEGTTGLQETRSGNWLAQPANFTASPERASSTAALTNPAGVSNLSGQSSFDSSGQATPIKAAFTSATSNWRDGLQNSISWDSDMQNAEGSGSGLETTGNRPWGSGQSVVAKPDKRGGARSEINSFAGLRNETDGSRPFNGTWPKPNSIPARPNQNPLTNSQTPDRSEGFPAHLDLDDLNSGTRYANGASTNLPSRAPGQWPDAPNR